jgi:hypothetical protein
MNEDTITIPDPVYMKWPKNYSCQDSPTPVLRINYKGLTNSLRCQNPAMITLSNKTSFTIPSCDYTTIHFNVLVTTSLPAVTLIYGNDFLFRHGLTCVINQIPTNDTLLYVKVYNNKSEALTFPKESLQFTCLTVLAKYP